MERCKVAVYGGSGGSLNMASDQLWAESQVLLQRKAVSIVTSFTNSHKGCLMG